MVNRSTSAIGRLLRSIPINGILAFAGMFDVQSGALMIDRRLGGTTIVLNSPARRKLPAWCFSQIALAMPAELLKFKRTVRQPDDPGAKAHFASGQESSPPGCEKHRRIP